MSRLGYYSYFYGIMEAPLRMVLFISVIVLIAIGCRKEEENKDPVIDISLPVEGGVFTAGDSIRVKAMISDDGSLAHVQLGLVDMDLNTVDASFNFYPDASSYELNFDYPVANIYLEQGDYYIKVKAFDGEKTRYRYRKMGINNVPRTLEGIVLITSRQNKAGVVCLDPEFQESWTSETGVDYADSELSSRFGQLYLAGRHSVNLMAFKLPEMTVEWKLDPVINPPMHETGCLHYEDALAVAFRNDYLRVYNDNGEIISSSETGQDKHPGEIILTKDILVVEMFNPSGGKRYLETYYCGSGILKQTIQIFFDVVELLPSDAGEILVIANRPDDEKGFVITYSSDANLLTEYLVLNEEIRCAEVIEDKTILLSTHSGKYAYTIPETSAILVSDQKADKIEWDGVNGHVYAIGDFRVSSYTWPGMQLLKTRQTSDSLMGVHLLYNR